jgi:hypothetical protein
VLQVTDVPETMQEFLDVLLADSWTDKFVSADEKSQDIRRGRPESSLYR